MKDFFKNKITKNEKKYIFYIFFNFFAKFTYLSYKKRRNFTYRLEILLNNFKLIKLILF